MPAPSQNAELRIGDGNTTEVFVTVGEVISFDGPGGSAQIIDTTHLASLAKEKAMGLADEGELGLELNCNFGDAGQDLMRDARTIQRLCNFRLQLPRGPATESAVLSPAQRATFQGYVSTFSLSAGVDNVIKASASVIITGSVGFADMTITASAPGTGTNNTSLNITGTISISGEPVEVALGTNPTLPPTTGWANATVTTTTFTGARTPTPAGTYYGWARYLNAPRIVFARSNAIVVS